jgi:hypothetical protein
MLASGTAGDPMTSIVFALLVACAPGSEVHDVSDGTACITDDTVTFTFDTCLSSSCSTVLSSSCTAALDGTDLTVTGAAQVEETDGDCTADCGILTATCTLPALDDPASITVHVGPDSGSIADFGCE